jgi:hypothetical protein
MKLHWLIPVSGLLAMAMNSCAPGVGAGAGFAAPFQKDSGTGGLKRGDGAIHSPPNRSAGASEAFAAPRKERPGLATTFGRPLKSPMPPTAFDRAGAKPYGVDAIYYNDREGLKAMNARDQKVGGFQTAAGGVLEWGIKGNFGMLPTYRSYHYSPRGYRRFVEGTHGGIYSIVLKNKCKADLQVVLSVDGLDVIDGKPASVSKRGYVVPAGETLEVKGYRTGYNSVAAFQFSSVSNSAVNQTQGSTRNVGVIGLAVYTPKNADVWTWMPKEINQRETAKPF